MSYKTLELEDTRVSSNLLESSVLEDMAWTQLKYSRKEINEAGAPLSSPINNDKIVQSIDIIDNFRAAHAFPLNTIQISLRKYAGRVNRNSIIAQRLKRLSSILWKLDRFKTMQLWDMQDIGGCRAIVHNVNEVKQLIDTYTSSRIRHRLVHEDDYIQQPRDSGYRSRHTVSCSFALSDFTFQHS